MVTIHVEVMTWWHLTDLSPHILFVIVVANVKYASSLQWCTTAWPKFACWDLLQHDLLSISDPRWRDKPSLPKTWFFTLPHKFATVCYLLTASVSTWQIWWTKELVGKAEILQVWKCLEKIPFSPSLFCRKPSSRIWAMVEKEMCCKLLNNIPLCTATATAGWFLQELSLQRPATDQSAG